MDIVIETYNKVRKIFDSDLDWEVKYDLIFTKEIQKAVVFDWNDPDAGYEEDVKAYMDGFENFMNYISQIK